MEPFATNYAKAIDDLSGKIFIPALICSLWVEVGPSVQKIWNLNLFWTYCIIVLVGSILAMSFMYLVYLIAIYIFQDFNFIPYLGVFLMPLGFAGLFPEQFNDINILYSKVTGMAILAWSFMLVKEKKFFQKFDL